MAISAVNTSTSTTTSAASQAGAKLALDAQNFLKLFLTQLQNQDPTAPFDANQMSAQLAQFSGVEQQIATNELLEELNIAFNATQYNNAVSYIGKKVEAPGNNASLKDGNGLFTYYLADKAETVKITIKDQVGNVVYEGGSSTDLGRNEFVWDGKSNSGETMPNGNYTFEVAAADAAQNEVSSQVFTSGVVTSIDSINGDVYVSVGNLSILISDVISIQAAS